MTGARRSLPVPVRHVPDAERRARLGSRHALARRVDSPEDVTRSMTALHATEPASVYLSCWARTSSMQVSDVDRALYDDRSVVKQLAMRRTAFVFPRDLLPAVWPTASARVAATERNHVVRDVLAEGISDDGEAWLDRARAAVLAVLAETPTGLSAVEIRRAVPQLELPGSAVTASRVLVQLGATADVMRGRNAGHWRTSRPQWTLTRNWLDVVPAVTTVEAGYREIVRRWLHSFGPGTEADLVWWLGGTKAVVRAALAGIGAVPVSLDSGDTGWLMPHDLDVVAEPEPWVALLPVLDPTIMGWYGREFYLSGHRRQIFDDRGNAGTTAWVDGRVVGCWVQDDAAVVRVCLLEPVPARVRRSLDAEAARLTQWLDGVRVGTVYPSPAMKDARTA